MPDEPPAPASRADRELAAHLENTPLAVIEGDAEFRLVHDDAAEVGRLMREIVALRRPRSVLVHRNYTRAGAVIWCEWHNSILLDDAGRLVSTLSLVLDVTGRRAAAEAVARSDARLRAALAAGMLGWEWDVATGRVDYSADPAGFFGVPLGDYTPGAAARRLIHPDDAPAAAEAARGAAAAGADLAYEFRGPAPAADGGDRWFAVRGQVVPGADGRPGWRR